MNAVETVKANMRLFIFAYVAWIAATAWIFLEPFPSTPTQLDAFGSPRVVACLEVIAHYERCAFFINLITATIAIILRAGVVFLAPLLLLLIGAAIFQRVSDRYNKNPPANPN
jgi:hypothetical protein